MRVRELMLSNFRVFGEPARFVFADSVSVVAGVNGKGKTAIMDALALLASRLLPLISPARSGYRTIAPTEVHAQAEQADLAFKVNCAGTPIDFRLNYSRQTRKMRRNPVPEAVRDQVKRAYGDPNRAGDQAPLVVYYTTDRAGFRMPRSLPRELPRDQSLAYVRALSSRMIDYRDFMARYKVWVDPDGRSGSAEAFGRALAIFLDGFSNPTVEESPLRLRVNKAGEALYLDQLSDGERSILAIVADLVRRLSLANPDIPDPLLGAGVVLIDEIELHLHPTWQRKVIEKLRTTFPNIQFIATTHSPFVIQSLRAGELINLDPEEFGEYADKSIEDIAENVMGVELPQKSERYRQMMDAAEAYFRLLKAPGPGAADLDAAEQRLNELAAPFSDDPAFQALLKLERETHREEGGDATR
jgi:predicted ATP-binding protein involved in virulence